MGEYNIHKLDNLKAGDPVVTKAKYDENGKFVSATVISHKPGSVMVEGPDGEMFYQTLEEQEHLAKIAIPKQKK